MTFVRPIEPNDAPASVRLGVQTLLKHVDREFLPPLSARGGTVSTDVEQAEPDLSRYLSALERESWLVAFHGRSVVGLLSYLDDHDDPAVISHSPSLYTTTIGVQRHVRGQGVATALYSALHGIALDRGTAYLTTRTWSSNAAHLRLLRGLGFELVRWLPDDRASGIGTVYLACHVRTGFRSISGREASVGRPTAVRNP